MIPTAHLHLIKVAALTPMLARRAREAIHSVAEVSEALADSEEHKVQEDSKT